MLNTNLLIKSAGRYGLSIALLLTIWHMVTVVFQVPPYVLPAPWEVVKTLSSEWPMFMHHAGVTLGNTFVGGVLGIGLGMLTGLLIAYSRTLRWIVEPYLVIFQSFPKEALIPVIVVWLGFGNEPKIVNAALLSFFPMAVFTANALLDTRSEYLELMRNWGGNKWQEFLYCRLPAGLQAIVGGLKITVPLALIGAVLGEFMGGNEGLGYIIVSSGASFRLDRSFAALIILSGAGIFALAAIRTLQDIVLKHYKQE